MKKTKKAFRELLNEQDKIGQAIGLSLFKHNRYRQVKRLYGDYLYYQDRIAFDVHYNDWLKQ